MYIWFRIFWCLYFREVTPYIKMPRVWWTKGRRPKESLGMLLEEGFRKTGKLQRDQEANGNFALLKCHA